MQDAELARKKCLEFGFKKKTPPHGTCMDQFRQATGAGKAPAQPSTTAPLISSVQLEEKFWDATMAVANKEAFEAYLDNYPRGRYAGLARANITRIDGAAPTQQRALVEASEKLATERAVTEAEQKAATADMLLHRGGVFTAVVLHHAHSAFTNLRGKTI